MTLFEKYPQLNNLRALVPDELIEREIGVHVPEFERSLAVAKARIPTVNLNRVFPAEMESGRIQLEHFLGHWGNVSIEELCKIALIVRWIKPKRILELGTYNGVTTLQMALNAPAECVTYTIDLPPDQAAALPLGPLDQLVSQHFKARFNTAVGSYFQGRKDLNIVQLWGDTATYDFNVGGGSFDIIFVDAAHDYANKRRDCETAFRFLSPGGVVLWHDYAQVANPDVTRCLAEFAAEKEIFHLRNTNLAVHVRR